MLAAVHSVCEKAIPVTPAVAPLLTLHVIRSQHSEAEHVLSSLPQGTPTRFCFIIYPSLPPCEESRHDSD